MEPAWATDIHLDDATEGPCSQSFCRGRIMVSTVSRPITRVIKPWGDHSMTWNRARATGNRRRVLILWMATTFLGFGICAGAW